MFFNSNAITLTNSIGIQDLKTDAISESDEVFAIQTVVNEWTFKCLC